MKSARNGFFFFLVIVGFISTSCSSISSVDDSGLFRNGTEFNRSMLTPDGSVLGDINSIVKNAVRNGDSMSAVIETHCYRQLLNDTDVYENVCKYSNGVFSIELNDLADYLVLPGKGRVRTITQTSMKYPTNMEIGNKLPDASVFVTLKDSSGESFYSTKITNRKVEAIETKKVVAGKWKCYKISYIKNIYIGEKLTWTYKVFEWFSFKVGVMRTETYYPSDFINMASATELSVYKKIES